MKTNYRNRCLVLSCLALSFAQAALVSTCAADATENRGQLSAADYKFAKEAASGGMMEVTLGKVAADKSVNPAVRQFGQRMVTDHGKAGDDLAKIASSKGASLPSEPTAVQQKETERLAKLSGPEFDKAYMALMVRDHKADEKEFKRASENTQDPELKAFAATTLTVVQDHLKMAEELAASLKHEVSMDK
jgi:putative membrane protein